MAERLGSLEIDAWREMRLAKAHGRVRIVGINAFLLALFVATRVRQAFWLFLCVCQIGRFVTLKEISSRSKQARR